MSIQSEENNAYVWQRAAGAVLPRTCQGRWGIEVTCKQQPRIGNPSKHVAVAFLNLHQIRCRLETGL